MNRRLTISEQRRKEDIESRTCPLCSQITPPREGENPVESVSRFVKCDSCNADLFFIKRRLTLGYLVPIDPEESYSGFYAKIEKDSTMTTNDEDIFTVVIYKGFRRYSFYKFSNGDCSGECIFDGKYMLKSTT